MPAFYSAYDSARTACKHEVHYSRQLRCLPVNIKVGLDFEAPALEGGHIIGFSSMLCMLVTTQVYLPPQLSHPNMRFPPA